MAIRIESINQSSTIDYPLILETINNFVNIGNSKSTVSIPLMALHWW